MSRPAWCRATLALAVTSSCLLWAAPADASRAYQGNTPCCIPDVFLTFPRVGVVYSAEPGEANSLDVTFGSGQYTLRDPGARIEAGNGCEPTPDPHVVTCSSQGFGGGLAVLAHLGDRGDTAALHDDGGGVPQGGELAGGSGEDVLTGGGQQFGGPGDDLLRGEGGRDDLEGDEGDDRIEGGSGNDGLTGDKGDDLQFGGSGRDYAAYGPFGRAATVTLDGRANDGQPGEMDNVAVDVESLIDLTDEGAALQSTYVGNTRRNGFSSEDGEDFLDGRRARDTLRAGADRDTLRARDGDRDVVACGGGVDFAIVDRSDRVIGCERRDDGIGNRPKRGREFVVRPAGELGLRLPGVGRFVPLEDRVNLPVASTIDAFELGPREAVRASFATSPGRPPARVDFYGGAVKIRQSRSSAGTVDIRLTDGRPRSSASRRARRGRQIWVSGRCKKCKVKSGYSHNQGVATTYLVEERCEGTLTFVRSGAVRVTDLRLRRTVTVRAGRRYLAKAPRRERLACRRR